MFKNFIKIFFRNLLKHPGNSLSNISGLAVGIATCILILLYVSYEFNWDTENDKFDRIYRLQTRNNSQSSWQVEVQTGYALANELQNKFPEIEDAAITRGVWGEYLSSADDKTFNEENGCYADDNIFKIFTCSFVRGNSADALSEPFTVVLTETTAKKYFPGESAYGKIIKATRNKILKVTGIIKDFPANSSFSPDYLVSLKTLKEVWEWKEYDHLENINSAIFHTYISLNTNASVQDINGKIRNFLNLYVTDNQKELYLKPLSELHLSPDDTVDIEVALYSLAGLAIFILILACINFINLSTASSNLRKKEIGVRKVVGASRKAIFGQFISESVLYAFISMLLAVLLSALLLPSFNTVIQRQLSMSFLADTNFIVLLIIVLVISGVFSGIYPAVYLSSFKPAEIIKSRIFNPVKNRKGLLRKSLVTFQFFISLFLIITTLYVIKQVSYMNNKYLGFDKKDLLIVKVFGDRSGGDFLTLKNELQKNSNILDASVSNNAPFVGNWGKEITWEGANENQKMNIMYNSVGYDFIDTYKMKIVKGRNFSREHPTDSEACLINETAWRQLGWDDPIGKKIDSSKFTIIGVVQDFHQYSVHEVIPAYYMTLKSEKLADNNLYSVRLQKGSDRETINFVRNEFKTFFPNAIIEALMFDTNLDIGTGTVWLTIERLFSIFTIIAILIAANGLFGLVSFTSQRRVKEIGIRKVLGAKTSRLYWIMSSELIVILLIASILAIPAAYFQASFVPGAYKYQLHIMDYVTSIGILLFTALAATVYQTTKTVFANPVESLRYE